MNYLTFFPVSKLRGATAGEGSEAITDAQQAIAFTFTSILGAAFAGTFGYFGLDATGNILFGASANNADPMPLTLYRIQFGVSPMGSTGLFSTSDTTITAIDNADFIYLTDTSDSNNPKKITLQNLFADNAGTTGQLLARTATGRQWVNAPSATIDDTNLYNLINNAPAQTPNVADTVPIADESESALGKVSFAAIRTAIGSTAANFEALVDDTNSNITVTVNNQQLRLNAPALSLSTFDTDDLTEGSTNLYFTDARALAAAPAETSTTLLGLINTTASNITITNTSGQLTLTAPSSSSLFAANDTIATPVDADSFYFTDASDSNNPKRVLGSNLKTYLGIPGDTDDLSEGSTNLYFTDARALAAAPAETSATILALVDTANSNITVTNVNNQLRLNAPSSTGLFAFSDTTETTIANADFMYFTDSSDTILLKNLHLRI